MENGSILDASRREGGMMGLHSSVDPDEPGRFPQMRQMPKMESRSMSEYSTRGRCVSRS